MSKYHWKSGVGWALVVIGAVVGVAALAPSPEPSESLPSKSPADPLESPTDPSIPRQPPPEVEARFQRLVGNMWWHQEAMGKTLELDDSQTEEMDRLCLGFLRHRWQRRQAELEQQDAFIEALKELDLSKAERLLTRRERRAAERAGAPDRLVLEVLNVLSSEQLELAKEQMPNLFEQPWIKGVSGSRKGRALERARAMRQRSAEPADARGGKP